MPKDILLDSGGDILISDAADISLKHSIRQDVKIRLQWFLEEWRFAPEFGLPYFEEVFVKNPNTGRIAQIIREEAMKVDGARDIRDVAVQIDVRTRNASLKFTILTDYGSFREEVAIRV